MEIAKIPRAITLVFLALIAAAQNRPIPKKMAVG